MAKKNSENSSIDPIEELNEWQEHQYNSGYWVNRFSPFFPPRRTAIRWLLDWIDVILLPPTFLAFCWLYWTEREPFNLILLLIVGFFMLVGFLRLWNLRPDFRKPSETSEAIEQKNREEKEERKKLPKRRKDFR
jgi:hypothetical protein